MPTETVKIELTLPAEVALQLAQFCKRSRFDQFYELTEAHLADDERKRRAYQMIGGIDALQGALANAGFAPR